MALAQRETYLSCVLHVFLNQGSCEGHATLRDGPVEEVLGQGRQHLAGEWTGREFMLMGRGLQEPPHP